VSLKVDEHHPALAEKKKGQFEQDGHGAGAVLARKGPRARRCSDPAKSVSPFEHLVRRAVASTFV